MNHIHMTWLDLYNFLHQRANDIKNLGSFDWQAQVVVHDAETGDEHSCDTYYISDNRGDDRFVLITNLEKVFND